jgi:hypothetical protein
MPDYIRGENITLIANFIDGGGTPILNGVSGIFTSAYYYTTSGTRTYIVNSGTMTQDSSDTNRFYYSTTIPNNAPLTNVIATYDATYSGLHVQTTEIFGITVAPTSTGIYIGSVAVNGFIVDLSGTGIYGAAVQAAPLNGGAVLTSTVTNTSGLYTLYLDPNDYLIIAGATGYTSNSVANTVTSGTTVFPNIALLAGSSSGAVAFSDTYLYTDPNTGGQSPLYNLKVTLYQAASSPTLTTPLATTRTDTSGTFAFTANNGDYVLKIEGNGPNNTVFDTAYDIEVSDAFAGGTPEGFRYRGTSQYSFI